MAPLLGTWTLQKQGQRTEPTSSFTTSLLCDLGGGDAGVWLPGLESQSHRYELCKRGQVS